MGASDFSYNDLDWEMRQIYNNQVGREAQLKLIKYLGADSCYPSRASGDTSPDQPGAFAPCLPLEVLTAPGRAHSPRHKQSDLPG